MNLIMSKKHTQEDINKLDNYGQTALHLVVNAGTDKPKLVRNSLK